MAAKTETLSLRIFGRGLTISCPPKEKNNLIKAAELLNNELEGIKDKNNALIIAGLTLANKQLSSKEDSGKSDTVDYSKLINKIEKAFSK